jgi:hypothetical protein
MKLTIAVLLALGVTVAGMGLLAFGPGSGPQAAAAQEGADRKPQTAKPAAEQDKKPAALNPATGEQARAWRAQMDKPVDDLGDLDNATVGDTLDVIEDRYGIRFEVNERAFVQEGLAKMRDAPLKTSPLPRLKNVTLATALRVVLDRLPVPALALIRKDTFEITTVNFVRAELGLPEGRPLQPLVWEEMEGVPLSRALQQLAKASGMNVALDPRALTEDLANLKITVQFANVPVDSAVRILANMADLQAVQVDNVLYVTTPKRAAQLLSEQKRPGDESPPAPQTPKQSGKMPGTGSM